MSLDRTLTACQKGACAACLIACCVLPATTHAATTCSTSMTNVAFGSSDPFTGWSDVTATINYSCQTTGLSLLASAAVRMCFSIGDGTAGTGTIFPRRMDNVGNTLNFNLYRDAAYSQVWGGLGNGQQVEVTLEYGVTISGSGSGSLAVYGRIPSSQDTAVPGSYQNSFSGADAEMVFQADEVLIGSATPPSNCLSGGDDSGTDFFPFSATANVEATCNPSFSVQDMDFGTHGLLNTSVDITATVAPQCTNTTPYQIGLDDGLHAAGNQRRMQNTVTGRYVTYGLYQDVGRSLRWGNTLGADTVSTTGTGNPQSRAIYGRVAAQSTPPSGTYSDTITVTITY